MSENSELGQDIGTLLVIIIGAGVGCYLLLKGLDRGIARRNKK